MTIRTCSICISAATILVLLLGTVFSFQLAPKANTAHARSLDYSSLNQIQKRILSGFADLELNPANADTSKSEPSNYTPRGSNACPVNLSSNIKVNQNCLNISDPDLQGRAQAEKVVLLHPLRTEKGRLVKAVPFPFSCELSWAFS